MRIRWPTVASLLVHVVAVGALLVASFWRIEKVEAKYVGIVIGGLELPPPAPPPPPPPAGGSPMGKTKPRPRVAREVTQPVQVERRAIEEEEQERAVPGGVAGGEEGGQEGGVLGGNQDGVLGGTPGGIPGGTGPATTPPAVEAPRIVPRSLIEGGRIAGNAQIFLPEATKQVMGAQGILAMDVAVKLCLSDAGVPTTIAFSKPSGFAELDEKIVREMRAWRYRPYQFGGKAVPVCTAVVFRYRLR